MSDLEPTINGPFTPDLATPLSKFGAFVKEQGWKDEISASLIGSCTNSSYEDMVSAVYDVKWAPLLNGANLDSRGRPGEAGQGGRAYGKGSVS